MTRVTGRMKLLPAVTALAILASACGKEHAVPTVAAEAPLAVQTALLATGDVTDAHEAGGTVQARTVTALAARVMGQVREVRVKAGDRVRAGQVLVVLDGADLAAQAKSASAAARAAGEGAAAADAELRAAEAALTLARASHGRVRALEASHSATKQELDEASATLAAAESRVAGARARVAQAAQGTASAEASSEAARIVESYTMLAAPFAGVVTEKLVEPGAMALPGMPLLRLEDPAAFRVEVRIDESGAARWTPGVTVDVVVDALGRTTPLAGHVEEVARAADVDARTFLVKVALPATPGLRSGLFGRVRVQGGPRQALQVPESAVVRRGQVSSVFVVEAGVAHLRLVDLRGREVLAGLATGDRIVIAPPPGLTDGRRVAEGGR